MKQALLFLALLIGTYQSGKAQGFNFQLTGNPVNTTGWNFSTQSSVNADAFILTTNIGNQAGYIYYATPQNLTNCSQFTVSFQFRITNSSIPTADGIAFWYISNPPSGFTLGGGIGLPNNPNGLVLLFDTYDNNSTPDNPLVSLRKFDGTTNYTEGSNVGQLTPDLTNQTFITDGTWHTCVLSYYFGTITVAFDGNAPVMTANTTLSLNGYFGFSASTGGSWATHAIKNVTISGAPEPAAPAGVDVTYCQGVPAAPLTVTGPTTNLKWYTVPTGGIILPGAPTPSTTAPGTYNWYVSRAVPGCNIESQRDTVTVTVNPKPGYPDIGIPKYCSGQISSPLVINSGNNVLWYTAPTGGTGSSTIPVINTTTPDTFTYYATQTSALGCESDRLPVVVIVRQTPIPNFTQTFAYACNQDTVHFQNTTNFGTNYLWDFGDSFIDTASNPTHIYAGQNTYYVKLKAYNQYCTDSVSKPVVINHPLVAAFNVSADTVCESTLVSFTDNSTATTVYNIDPTYLWSFGDGTTSTLQNPTHAYNVPGTFHVRMVIQNGVPCTDTIYKDIYVDSIPVLSFTRNDTAVCQGALVEFTGSYTQSGLQNMIWNFGDTPDSIYNVNPATHAFETPGVYTVSLSGHYRVCPDASASYQVTIKPMPTIYLGPDTTLCLDGAPITLVDATNQANPKASWLWNTGATTPSIEVRHDGIYTATVTIDQCSTSDNVFVKKDCQIDVPNSFTPNGDGVNDYFFPRQLLSSGVASFNMSIYNRWGQKIFETENPNGRGWDGKFNGKDQPEGVFIYSIKVVMKNLRAEEYTGNVTLLR